MAGKGRDPTTSHCVAHSQLTTTTMRQDASDSGSLNGAWPFLGIALSSYVHYTSMKDDGDDNNNKMAEVEKNNNTITEKQ